MCFVIAVMKALPKYRALDFTEHVIVQESMCPPRTGKQESRKQWDGPQKWPDQLSR